MSAFSLLRGDAPNLFDGPHRSTTKSPMSKNAVQQPQRRSAQMAEVSHLDEMEMLRLTGASDLPGLLAALRLLDKEGISLALRQIVAGAKKSAQIGCLAVFDAWMDRLPPSEFYAPDPAALLEIAQMAALRGSFDCLLSLARRAGDHWPDFARKNALLLGHAASGKNADMVRWLIPQTRANALFAGGVYTALGASLLEMARDSSPEPSGEIVALLANPKTVSFRNVKGETPSQIIAGINEHGAQHAGVAIKLVWPFVAPEDQMRHFTECARHGTVKTMTALWGLRLLAPEEISSLAELSALNARSPGMIDWLASRTPKNALPVLRDHAFALVRRIHASNHSQGFSAPTEQDIDRAIRQTLPWLSAWSESAEILAESESTQILPENGNKNENENANLAPPARPARAIRHL